MPLIIFGDVHRELPPPHTHTHTHTHTQPSPSPGLSWEHVVLASLSALLQEFITKPTDVQTQLQTIHNTSISLHLPPLSLSYFNTFPFICGRRKQGALICVALLVIFFFFSADEFPQQAHCETCLASVSRRAERFSKTGGMRKN